MAARSLGATQAEYQMELCDRDWIRRRHGLQHLHSPDWCGEFGDGAKWAPAPRQSSVICK